MNIELKILWVDDTRSWVRATSKDVEKIIYSLNFIPKIDHSKGDDNDIITQEYDLILMDFKLIRGISGDQLIKNIRAHGILTDIIFYSSEYEKMRDSIIEQDVLFDGVYYSNRGETDFNEKVEGVLRKIVKKSEDIVNIRGIVMDNTSDFDTDIENVILLAYSKLTDMDQSIIDSKFRKKIKSSLKCINADLGKYCEGELGIIDALSEPGYIVDANTRARVLNDIIVHYHNTHNILSEHNSFYKEYSSDILWYRNKLAHAKQDFRESNVCIGVKNEKDVILNSQLCYDIRNNILKYKKVFVNLYDTLSLHNSDRE